MSASIYHKDNMNNEIIAKLEMLIDISSATKQLEEELTPEEISKKEFSDHQILSWLELAESPESTNFKPLGEFTTNLKHKLIEAKMLTDRWGNVATDISLHPSKREILTQCDSVHHNQIWGAKLHYRDIVPEHLGLMIAEIALMREDDENPDLELYTRGLALFPM